MCFKRLLTTTAAALLLQCSTLAYADTFGSNPAGTPANAGFEVQPTCSKYTAATGGTITKISVYVGTFGATTYRTAIYSDNAGVPLTKLAESSDAASGGGGTGWKDTTVSYVFTAGTYHLCIFASDANSLIYHDTGTTGQAHDDAGNTYPTWPDPFVVNATFDRAYGIYATYTPSASSGGGLLMMGVGK